MLTATPSGYPQLCNGAFAALAREPLKVACSQPSMTS
jgi:hypothetical protein